MVNYQLGKIYKITSPSCEFIYIGSTTKKYLSQRLTKHKSGCKEWMEGKSNYVSSYSLILFEDVEITLLELCPCNSKDELKARERYYIEKNKNLCLNRNIPGRTKKEWRKDNKEKEKQQRKEYCKNNKDKVKEWNRNKWNKFGEKYNKDKAIIIKCECGSKVRKSGRARHRRSKTHELWELSN